VRYEVLRLLRARPSHEVGRRADDRHADLGSDPRRNYVLGDLAAGVEPAEGEC
jgi:hypothetical protein